MTKKIYYLSLVVCIAICFGAAAIGSAVTDTSVGDWYKTLEKPTWNPPSWVFGPVWTVLYICMAVSLWLVWIRRESTSIKSALILFAVQLFANAIWSVLFFGLKNPLWALFDILVLLVAIAATMTVFWKTSKAAGWLMLPYFLWVCFATFLNYSIWSLNA